MEVKGDWSLDSDKPNYVLPKKLSYKYVEDVDNPNWLEVEVVAVTEEETKHKEPKDRRKYLRIAYLTTDGQWSHEQNYFKGEDLKLLFQLFEIKSVKEADSLVNKKLWIHLGLRLGTGRYRNFNFVAIDGYSLDSRSEPSIDLSAIDPPKGGPPVTEIEEELPF